MVTEKMSKKVGRVAEKMKDLEEQGKSKKSQKYAELLDDLKRDKSVRGRLNLEVGGVSKRTSNSSGSLETLDVNKLLQELKDKDREIASLKERYAQQERQAKGRDAEERKYIRLISDLRDKLNDANLAVMNKAMNRYQPSVTVSCSLTPVVVC